MRKFGLIGKSLGHSFSKNFFTQKFEKESINATYENFELEDIKEFKSLIDSNELSGLNVTIPYKQLVIKHLNKLSNEAKDIGAVNTIQFKNGKTIGHNTDAYGFQQSIKPFLTFHHEKALVLGTGGASLAVKYVLENLGIEVLTISRTAKGSLIFNYNDINEHMIHACKFIVNTTPVGTYPNLKDHVVFPFEFLTQEHLVMDLIYNPEKTAFLRKSQEAGATILNGQSMLEHQALKAWEIWNS